MILDDFGVDGKNTLTISEMTKYFFRSDSDSCKNFFRSDSALTKNFFWMTSALTKNFFERGKGSFLARENVCLRPFCLRENYFPKKLAFLF